jgi:hypothetical protein
MPILPPQFKPQYRNTSPKSRLTAAATPAPAGLAPNEPSPLKRTAKPNSPEIVVAYSQLIQKRGVDYAISYPTARATLLTFCLHCPGENCCKQKIALIAAANSWIFQIKSGAGGGIRTLDPNLGNGLQGYAPGYPGGRQTTINRAFSIYCRRRSPPSVSPDIPRLSSKCLDSALEGGIRANF